MLACIQKDEDGKPYLTAQQKELFILLGDSSGKLPEEKTLVQEYNPEIRVDQITKAFELVLSLLSMEFGYGSKKYTFENGQIKTATEYIGTKQDAMQELNKQRKQATDYIEDIIHAAMWFSNQFSGTNYNLKEVLSIEFDDSYVEDLSLIHILHDHTYRRCIRGCRKKHHNKIQRDIFEHGRYRNVQIFKHYQENLLNKDR